MQLNFGKRLEDTPPLSDRGGQEEASIDANASLREEGVVSFVSALVFGP